MDICLRVLKESNKGRFDSFSVRNSVLLISHTTFRDCRVHIFSDNLSRNSCISVRTSTPLSYDLFKLKIVQKKKTTVTLHPFFLLSGKYWLDPNGGCSEDAFQADCKFTKEGQTCVYPKQQQVDYMIQFSLHFGLACLE